MLLRFPIILVIIFFLIDFYLYQAVKLVILNNSSRTKRMIKWIFWAIPIIAFASLVAILLKRGYISGYFFMASFLLYVSKMISIIILFLEDIIRFFMGVYRRIKKELFSKEKTVNKKLEKNLGPSKEKKNVGASFLLLGFLLWTMTVF